MSEKDLTISVAENLKPSTSKKLREAVADAFVFIRSAEANQAIATVSLEQLMGDQIIRNGESERSNASQYDPYSFNPKKKESASSKAQPRANFLSATDTNMATKLDRLLAITNNIEKIVSEIKRMQPVDVASAEEYTDVADVAAPTDDEE
jgi:hypothetical protein